MNDQEQEVWLRSYCAAIEKNTGVMPSLYADQALADFRERWPGEPAPTPAHVKDCRTCWHRTGPGACNDPNVSLDEFNRRISQQPITDCPGWTAKGGGPHD